MRAKALKRAEEEKHYGIRFGVEGVPFLLSQHFLETVWNSEQPKEDTYAYLSKQFERLGVLHKLRPCEVRTFANQIIYDLIFVRQKLEPSAAKCYWLCNILFMNFINKDRRFALEFPVVREKDPNLAEEPPQEEEEEKQPDNPLASIPLEDGEELDDYRDKLEVQEALAEKSYEGDLAAFKANLAKVAKKYSSQMSSKAEIAAIVTHAMNSYFDNYNLIRYNAIFRPSEETLYLQVSVDEPTVLPPLADAVMTGREEVPIEEVNPEEELRAKKEQEEREKKLRDAQEELERKKQEEWLGLDDRTIQLIQERLEKTRIEMIKKLETKKEEYNEKLLANKIQLKKK